LHKKRNATKSQHSIEHHEQSEEFLAQKNRVENLFPDANVRESTGPNGFPEAGSLPSDQDCSIFVAGPKTMRKDANIDDISY